MAAEILQDHEVEIASITLVPSEGGRFEVTVNDQLLFSKLKLGRHAEPGEIVTLIQKTYRLPG